jgi:three-Cys-motif partner protein
MADRKFFDEALEQSKVKAAIVSKYFWSWAKIIISVNKRRGEDRIAYIDLFAGPGRYKDGTKSTPLLILEKAIQDPDPDMRRMLVTHFNDYDAENVRSLESAINSLPGIETLKYKPVVHNETVGEEIVKDFERTRLVPTLFFVDPWGYKGLSLRLVNSVLGNWGSDCIVFFNYNRINMGLSNEAVKLHMDALFGEDRAEALRPRLDAIRPQERELAIVEEIGQALKGMGGKYVLPFRFRDERGSRTSHHLIFVSKHPLGYGIMKDIMAGESSSSEQGVASFEYSPADEEFPFLAGFNRPLDDLAEELMRHFAGRRLSMVAIYEEHNVDRPFIKKNYKDALIKLHEGGKIGITTPNGKLRRRGTFADDIIVQFPSI